MGSDFSTAAFRVVGSLMLITGLIIGLFYLLKQLRQRALSIKRYPEMRLIGTLHLAPRRAVALIEICDQWLVVGIGTENVTLISKLERPPEAADSASISAGNGRDFLSFVQKAGLRQPGKRTTIMRKDAKS